MSIVDPTGDNGIFSPWPDPTEDPYGFHRPEVRDAYQTKRYRDVEDVCYSITRLTRSIPLPKTVWGGNKKCAMSEVSPTLVPGEVLLPAIVWHVVSRTQDERTRKPRFMKGFVEGNSTVLTSYKVFNNIVQFDCYDKSNHEANSLVTWFESIMETYTPLFMLLGADELWYSERREDSLLGVQQGAGSAKYPVRSVRYHIRTRMPLVERRSNLESVRAQLSVGSTLVTGEAVVRGSGDYDTLANPMVLAVLRISDIPGEIETPNLYALYTDYILYTDRLYWNLGGRAPTAGSTYYVDYLHSDPITMEVVPETLG